MAEHAKKFRRAPRSTPAVSDPKPSGKDTKWIRPNEPPMFSFSVVSEAAILNVIERGKDLLAGRLTRTKPWTS